MLLWCHSSALILVFLSHCPLIWGRSCGRWLVSPSFLSCSCLLASVCHTCRSSGDAPCCDESEHRVPAGRSRGPSGASVGPGENGHEEPEMEVILNSEFCIPLMHWSSNHSYKNFHKEKADKINTLHVKYFSTAPLGCCRSSPGLRGRRQHFPMWTNRCWRVEYESHTDWTEFHWAAPDKPRHKSSAMHSFQRLTDRHPVTYLWRITLGMINSLNFINNFLFKSYPDITVYLFW